VSVARYLLGLDLGQAADYTAIVALERKPEVTGHEESWERGHRMLRPEYRDKYRVVAAERLPLHTSYSAIVDYVAKRVEQLRGDCELIVDATGVGRPVVDMLGERDVPLIPVLITGGHAETVDGLGFWHVPKGSLVVHVNTVLAEQRLTIPRALEQQAQLVHELMAFRVKKTKTGGNTMEAWRESDHDDLVLAMALACWWGETHPTEGEPFEHAPRKPEERAAYESERLERARDAAIAKNLSDEWWQR